MASTTSLNDHIQNELRRLAAEPPLTLRMKLPWRGGRRFVFQGSGAALFAASCDRLSNGIAEYDTHCYPAYGRQQNEADCLIGIEAMNLH